MPDITTYSPKNCQVTLDGRDVVGLWEGDDAVTVQRSSDLSSPTVGADGSTIVSTSADQSAKITIKLMHTSAAHKRLLGYKASMQERGVTRKFPVSIRDTESGEGGSAAECVIIITPTVNTGSAKAGVREWQIFAGRWKDNPVNYAD